MIHIVSRRNPNWIVTLATMLLVAMLVSACGGATPAPATETTAPTPKPAEPTAAPEISPHQAPQWQEMVTAGELPPLEERLPVNPIVLNHWTPLVSMAARCAIPYSVRGHPAFTPLWATKTW